MNPISLPAVQPVFEALLPWAIALLRVACGLALLPHSLRAFFGFFPNTGSPVSTPAQIAASIARSGFKPGFVFVPFVALVEFVAGPALALGLFTHAAALLIVVFFLGASYDHLRWDGYFWNKLGVEYPALWCAIAFYFAASGGGPISLDALIGG